MRFLGMICCLLVLPCLGLWGQEQEEPPEALDTLKTESGLTYIRYQAGEGTEHPEEGDKVVLSYYGMLEDGTVFGSSEKHGPIKFKIGKGKVIPGWEEGVQLMTKGEVGLLIVPPEMGYGKKGYPDKKNPEKSIPPEATLYFDVKLLDF